MPSCMTSASLLKALANGFSKGVPRYWERAFSATNSASTSPSVAGMVGKLVTSSV